jgi:hypothetical protein
VPGNTIFGAVAAVREAILHSEITPVALGILTLDFKEAVDRISHTYLLTILRNCGFSDWFVYRIKRVYDNARSSVQINGHIAGPISIRCSVL